MLQDHLGNVRVLFADLDSDGKIEGDDPNTPSNESELMQINSYYPFGMLHEGGWNGTNNTTALEYGFGGKELNEDLGLNWMDFGGRWYMADLGRWNAVDPLAEQGYSRTPYHYVRNNPLAFVDPTGFGEKGAVRPDVAASDTALEQKRRRKAAYEERQRERDAKYGLSSPTNSSDPPEDIVRAIQNAFLLHAAAKADDGVEALGHVRPGLPSELLGIGNLNTSFDGIPRDNNILSNQQAIFEGVVLTIGGNTVIADKVVIIIKDKRQSTTIQKIMNWLSF